MAIIQPALFSALFLLVSTAAFARQAEPYCGWTTSISEARVDVSDNALLSESKSSEAAAIEAAKAEHPPFGWPVRTSGDGDGEHILAQPDFIIWYDNDLLAPLWAAEHLTQSEATTERQRAESFRTDPRLKWSWQKSECADYEEPIFDRGHVIPRADMNFSEVAMDQTFLMTNMTPQHCAFNRGIWQILEQLGRRWAAAFSDTWIITGTVFDRDGTRGRDPDQAAWRMKGKRGVRVAIPSDQYKIFVRRDGSGWQTLSILLPNTDTLVSKEEAEGYLTLHITTIQHISDLSGFRFLAGEAVDEAASLWPFSGAMPSPLTSNCHASYPDF